jgi:hypothetical protein
MSSSMATSATHVFNPAKSLDNISLAFQRSLNENVKINTGLYVIFIIMIIIMFVLLTFGLFSEFYDRLGISLPHKYIPYIREYFINSKNHKMTTQ